MSWEGGGTTKYDPTLTRVVYASSVEEDDIGNGEQGYVLWDMTNQKNWWKSRLVIFTIPQNGLQTDQDLLLVALAEKFSLLAVMGESLGLRISIGKIIYSPPLPEIYYVPVCSPNGNNVVFVANWEEDGTFDTLLIDFEGGLAAKVGEIWCQKAGLILVIKGNSL